MEEPTSHPPRVFWDLDECLISTRVYAGLSRFDDQGDFSFEFDDEPGTRYSTFIRPAARVLVDTARAWFGNENVFILTSSARDYAMKINELGDLGFPTDQILSRNELDRHMIRGCYGSNPIASGFASPLNLLIDDLPPRENERKIAYLGMADTYSTRYLQAPDFYRNRAVSSDKETPAQLQSRLREEHDFVTLVTNFINTHKP